ncbi:MAG: hypothetical protein K8T25_09285 [Planctomycetia bacterium]|nr:hypothetical protein [Planctomycetia bacterium]
MGVQSDLIIADLAEAQAVAETDCPAADWDGFTFNGLDNVKLCTLLSLLHAGDPTLKFDHYLNLVDVASLPAEEGPVVFALKSQQVTELAAISSLEVAEFEKLAKSWGCTEELERWSGAEVSELLQAIGDLAETAMLERKCLLLWQSL